MAYDKKLLGAIGLTGGMLLGGTAITSELLFRFACQRNLPENRPRRKKTDDDLGRGKSAQLLRDGAMWFRSKNYEEIQIKSVDGLKLTGYFLKKKKAKQTMLLVHGYRGHGIDDFGYIGKFYYEHGCNLLIIDQRANTKSEGDYITFGALESRDVVTWAWKIHDDLAPKLPIFLDGVSMGATSVLLATGQLLPKTVKGVIADCGFTSAKDEIEHVAQNMFHLPKYPLISIVEFLCRKRAKFSFQETSVKDALKKNQLPILFVHGGKDDFVPTRMSVENYINCPSKKYLEIVDEAKHGMSYMVEEKRCQKKLLEFLDECLKRKKASNV